MSLNFIVTNVGRTALINAQANGTAPVVIAKVGISATAITATPTTSTLPAEIKRISGVSGNAVSTDTIHLVIRDDSADVYTVRSLALYLADGTLFGSYGSPDAIINKTALSAMLLAIDVMFADIAATAVTFGNTNFLNPPATTDTQGIVELATDTEVSDGTDAQRAVTPRGLKGLLDTRFGAGAPSAFVKTLLNAATVAAFRALLFIKSAALRDEGSGNGLDADKVDGFHAAAPATPSTLVVRDSAGAVNVQDVLASRNNGTGAVYLGTIGSYLFFDGTRFVFSHQATVGGSTIWHANNDGAGSGMDADLLRGLAPAESGASVILKTASSGYLLLDSWIRGTGIYTGASRVAFQSGAGTAHSDPSGTVKGYTHFDYNGFGLLNETGQWSVRCYTGSALGGQLHGNWTMGGNGGASTGYQIWTAATDGAGSGCDSDMLDGYHASNFLGFNGLSYYQASTWIQFGPRAQGLYWPQNAGGGGMTHFYPSIGDGWTFGSAVISGQTNGYAGVNFTDYGWQVMGNGSVRGIYRPGAGWDFYGDGSNLYIGAGAAIAWTAANDGSGSGSDADMLDGHHAYEFAAASHGHGAGDIASAFPTSIASDGYIILPSGLIIAWGSFSNYGNSYAYPSFPIAFPNICLQCIVAGDALQDSNAKDNPPGLVNFNQYYATVFNANDQQLGGRYIAIGY